MSRELIEFKRNQAGGRDDGEVFGPPFPQQQSHPFGEQKARIDKCSHACRPELPRSKRKHTGQQAVDHAIVGIHPHYLHPVRDRLFDVPVQELHRADANGKQQKSFDQLEQGNQQECCGALAFARRLPATPR